MALSLGDWHGIYMLGSEYEARRANPCWSAVLRQLDSKLHLVSDLDAVLGRGLISVVLMEGDPDFLQSLFRLIPPSWPLLLLLPGGWTRPVMEGVHWLCVSHKQCGGVTTARVNVGRRGLPVIKFETVVQRTLGAVIQHSIRPSYCSGPDVASSMYCCEDRLHPWHMERDILLPTTFYKSGWGRRALEPRELGAAFDLPLWLLDDSTAFDWWFQHILHPRSVPVKIAGSVLRELLPSLEPVFVHHLSTAGRKHGGPSSPSRPAKRGRWLTEPYEEWRDGVLGTSLPHLPAFLPHGAWLDESIVTDSAVKSDDAVAPFWIWDGRIRGIYPWLTPSALAGFRSLALRWWRKSLFRSFLRYLSSRFGNDWRRLVHSPAPSKGGDSFSLSAVHAAGCTVLHQVLASTWWDWDVGSSLLFWRWNGLSQQRDAWAGTPIHVSGPLPDYHKPQRAPPIELRPKVAVKLSTVLQRGYLDQEPPISSMTDFFAVPKGDADIRMVYNGTSCGLNEVLWAPNFWLPTAESALRLLTPRSYCGDMDLGEMFLNFPMDSKLRPYAGVDLSSIEQDLPQGILQPGNNKVRWNRLFMGMLPSPFHAARQYYLAEEVAKGSPHDPINPCGFDEIRFNIPGSADYTPTRPWVMKWNLRMDDIAGDSVTYMDDIRTIGCNAENAWQVARRLGSRLQYMGIQDAPRKRRPPSKTPGAWAGSLLRKTMTITHLERNAPTMTSSRPHSKER